MIAPNFECQIIALLGNADTATTTARETHGLGLQSEAPQVEVLRLTNTILVHQQSALVHELCGAHVNIIDIIVHIHGSSVIRAMLLDDFPYTAILIHRIIVCNRVPVSPSQLPEFSLLNGRCYGVRTCGIMAVALGPAIANRSDQPYLF